MNNKKMELEIQRIIKVSIEYWLELNKMYGYPPLRICFFNTQFNKPYEEDSVAVVKDAIDANMILLSTAHGETNEDIPWDEQIVEGVQSSVFMSYEKLYSLIIDCELNFQKVEECMKFMLRHEMGHVIDMNNLCLGKTVKEWNEIHKLHQEQMNLVPKMRKNASYENRLNWFLTYNSSPPEKRANEAVGITEDDITNYWKNTHPHK